MTHSDNEKYDEELGKQFEALRRDLAPLKFSPDYNRVMKKKKSKVAFFAIPAGLAAAALIAFVVTTSLQQQAPAKQEVLAQFTFVRGKVTLNEQKVRVGQRAIPGQTIDVKKGSTAVLQFDRKALLTISANTTIKVDELVKKTKPVIKLSQTRGSSFSKVIPQSAEYQVKTPTAVAGIRGTAFQISLNKKKQTTIKMLRGKVRVKTAKAKTEKLITKGKEIKISKKGFSKIKKVSKKDQEQLSRFDTIKIQPIQVAAVEQASENETEPTGQPAVVNVPDEVVAELTRVAVKKKKETQPEKAKPTKKEKKAMTLAELKAKYGQLTQITTVAGKKVVGAKWRQVGDYHYLLTTKGQKKIQTSKVLKVLPLD